MELQASLIGDEDNQFCGNNDEMNRLEGISQIVREYGSSLSGEQK